LLGTTSNKIQRHSKSAKGFSANDAMSQFNYYGQTRLQNLDEHDIVGLEREIDFIMKMSNVGNSPQRGMTGNGDYNDQNIVNING
jgi:hypothetical protein